MKNNILISVVTVSYNAVATIEQTLLSVINQTYPINNFISILFNDIYSSVRTTSIYNDVLIGTRCIILKGVTIGARSIIGSGSVVVKTIPADCIAAGNPCKVIKYINEE